MNNSQNNQGHHSGGFENAILKIIEEVSYLTWNGLVVLVKKDARSFLKSLCAYIAGFYFIRYLAFRAWHLEFLHWLWPAFFSGKVLKWFFSIPVEYHYWGMFLSISWLSVMIAGALKVRSTRKIKEAFETIGLKNGVGLTPALIAHYRFEGTREKYLFKANGVSLSQFESKRDELAAIFQKPVDYLKTAGNPSIIELGLSNNAIPKFVSFEGTGTELAPEHFYIGDNGKAIISRDLKTLPHMLIAGSTGGGKSVFFKQTVAGLLQSTTKIQVYLIDLKKGLEAADFKEAPNVAIAKDFQDAVFFLKAVCKEMDKRFRYLESKGYKSIDPERDNLDRILIAVDEASELYADKSKFDDDYELAQQAQKLTNSIARLGRAAGIHLILATQKVNKESINTVIQENISARMCFKMNTLQGSLQVIGSKDALDLPMIPGRGIWQLGNEEFKVQVPLVQDQTLRRICENIRNEFAENERELHQPMLINSKGEQQGNAPLSELIDLDE